MHKRALAAGAFFAGLAVVLGAFAAHGLKAILPEQQLRIFDTAARYQFYHSFALMITGIVFASFPVKMLRMATTFFIIGILLFSGSLYVLSLVSNSGANIMAIGILTPIGGLFFIGGWVCFLVGVVSGQGQD